MLFAVRFIDKPNQHETRKQWLQAHLDWLDQHQECVLIGGSLRLEPDQQAVWLMDSGSKQQGGNRIPDPNRPVLDTGATSILRNFSLVESVCR